MKDDLDRFVAAAPQPQQAALRALLALARRPRGSRLLRRMGPLDQAVNGLVAMARFDEPGAAVHLGWDPEAVVARGRALREAEGRP